jgi:hypothetical protein
MKKIFVLAVLFITAAATATAQQKTSKKTTSAQYLFNQMEENLANIEQVVVMQESVPHTFFAAFSVSRINESKVLVSYQIGSGKHSRDGEVLMYHTGENRYEAILVNGKGPSVTLYGVYDEASAKLIFAGTDQNSKPIRLTLKLGHNSSFTLDMKLSESKNI